MDRMIEREGIATPILSTLSIPVKGHWPLMMQLGHAIPLHCAHMLLQHRYSRLLWLFDLHRMLLTADPAEAALARDAAARWQLAPATALAVRRVRELFGTPLSEGLGQWVDAAGRSPTLQAQVSAAALAPEGPEMPHYDLVNLLMNRDLRQLFH